MSHAVGRVAQRLGRWLREDSTPWWGDSYDNDDANVNDFYDGVAIDGAGDVIAVGFETVLGQQTNVFIREYRPL